MKTITDITGKEKSREFPKPLGKKTRILKKSNINQTKTKKPKNQDPGVFFPRITRGDGKKTTISPIPSTSVVHSEAINKTSFSPDLIRNSRASSLSSFSSKLLSKRSIKVYQDLKVSDESTIALAKPNLSKLASPTNKSITNTITKNPNFDSKYPKEIAQNIVKDNEGEVEQRYKINIEYIDKVGSGLKKKDEQAKGSFLFPLAPGVLERRPVCIMKTKVDFQMKYYSISYYYKSSSSLLSIKCKDNDVNCSMEASIPSNYSTFDYIKQFIEPRINLVNDTLVLEEPRVVIITEGSFIRENSSGSILISRFYPRWRIEVKINDFSKVFEMAEIKSNFPPNIDFNKDNHFMLNIFICDEKGIRVNVGMSYPLELIFDGCIENKYLSCPITIQILKINYVSHYTFMIKEKEFDYYPLIIDGSAIAKKIDKIRPSQGEIANFLKCTVYVKEFQLVLTDDKNPQYFKRQISRKPSNNTMAISRKLSNLQNFNNSDTSMKKNSTFLSRKSSCIYENSEYLDSYQMKSVIEEYYEPVDACKVLEECTKLLFQNKTDIDIDENRIVLRTCLFRNNQIYQVSLSITENEILNFFIRKGSSNENLSRLSVSMTMLSEKIGIEREYILPLASFLLRNMLIIKESDICYFDFSDYGEAHNRAYNKIASLFKGFIIRKKFKLFLKQLIGKRKVRIQMAVYSCLLYLANEVLYVRLVRNAEVLGIDLNFKSVAKEGLISSIDIFYNSLNKLGFDIVEKNGIKKLVANERFVFRKNMNGK